MKPLSSNSRMRPNLGEDSLCEPGRSATEGLIEVSAQVLGILATYLF